MPISAVADGAMRAAIHSHREEAQRLVTEIRQGLEEFYRTGMKLLRLSEPELYGALGYATFEGCCKAEFEWTRQHAYRLIRAAEYRAVLPDVTAAVTSDGASWS